MECYNQGYISLRLVILVILGHTDLRLRFRFTSRAAFCAVTSSKYCKSELSELSAASKYLNGEKKCFKSDLNGNDDDDDDDAKVGKLPLFYNYNYNYNYGNHFEHVFGPIRAMLAELEAFQNCYNCYNLYLYLDGENVGMRGNHFRRVFEPIRAILAEIEGYQFFQNLSDKSDNAELGLQGLRGCGCDELSSGPGNGNGNVDARSMSVLMSMSMSISISTDLVYKQKTGNGKHGKSKGNLYLYLYLEKQLIV